MMLLAIIALSYAQEFTPSSTLETDIQQSTSASQAHQSRQLIVLCGVSVCLLVLLCAYATTCIVSFT